MSSSVTFPSALLVAALLAGCSDSCFVRGSRVLTPHGWRPIESLAIGDEVVGFDPALATITVRRVREVLRREVPRIIRLRAGEIAIAGVSPEHPFWDAAAGAFRPAVSLSLESRVLVLLPGARAPREVGVEEVAVVASRWPIEVWNLEVEGEHTYFVEGMLVHNKETCGTPDCTGVGGAGGSSGTGEASTGAGPTGTGGSGGDGGVGQGGNGDGGSGSVGTGGESSASVTNGAGGTNGDGGAGGGAQVELPDVSAIVQEVASQHPELLEINTYESCGQLIQHVLARLSADDPEWGHVAKTSGEGQYSPPGWVPVDIDGYTITGFSQDAIFHRAAYRQVDIIGNAAANSDPDKSIHGPGTITWQVIEPESYRENNPWMAPVPLP